MATVAQVISRAFGLLGVEDPNDSLDTLFYTDALYVLNEMLGSWSAEGFLPPSSQEISHSITSGVYSYTIGTGATINTTRPTDILSAFVRDASGIDTPVRIIAKKDYDRYGDKDATGRPHSLYYDATKATGTIYLFPSPDQAYTLIMTEPIPFAQYSATSDTITLPNEFLGAMSYNLAPMIAPSFQVQPSPHVFSEGMKLLRNVKRLHANKVEGLETRPFRARNRDFNINSGGYYNE